MIFAAFFRRARWQCLVLAGIGLMPVASAQTVAWTALSRGGSGDVDAKPACGEGVRGKHGLAVDATGNTYVTGCAFNGRNQDYLTVKFGPDGALLWSARYNNGATTGQDQAYALAVDSAGDVLVTGLSVGADLTNDYATVKYAGATGDQVWVARYTGATIGYDQAYALAVDSAGDVLVTGGSSGDYATVKYAGATGAQEWVARYSGPANGNQAYALAIDSEGDVLVTGQSNNGSLYDYATVKYSGRTGTQVWVARYNGPANEDDHAYAVEIDSAGDVLVTGQSSNGSNNDYATVKYARGTGAQVWVTRYNGPANSSDQAYALSVDSAGDVLVTGQSNSDYATVKYLGSVGAQVWATRYNGRANGSDGALALSVTNVGDVLVTGQSFNGSNNDYATLKYAGATGLQVWRSQEPEQAGLAESLSCGDSIRGKSGLAVDTAGNAFVTGCAFNGSNQDYQTVKMAPDGTVLWTSLYSGPANSDDQAYALAVDSAGDVLVTGQSSNGSNNDYATVKYAGATGDQVWVSRFNGPANGNDQAYVDISGHGRPPFRTMGGQHSGACEATVPGHVRPFAQ